MFQVLSFVLLLSISLDGWLPVQNEVYLSPVSNLNHHLINEVRTLPGLNPVPQRLENIIPLLVVYVWAFAD